MDESINLEGLTLEEKIKAIQDRAKRIEDELFHSSNTPGRYEDDYDDFGEYDYMPSWEV